MQLEPVTPPAEPCVTLAEAKEHLNYAAADRDAYVTGLIAAATAHLDGREGMLGRALVAQAWELRLDMFPACGVIRLPLPPLVSVDSISYVDTTGVVQTLATSEYVVDTSIVDGRVRRAHGATWPLVRDERGAVRVRFTAGWATGVAVPNPIRQAILLLVSHWWFNREAVGDVGQPVAFAVDALTRPYKMLRV